jgi:four helix bundle protein
MNALFDHEKLDVYQLELRFIAWVTPLLEEAKAKNRVKTAEVCDQLDRASLSALLNTAEGNGKRQRQVRAKFFDDARGSATECAACLDALVAKGACEVGRIEQGKELLFRVVSILTKLIHMFSDEGRMREDEVEYKTGHDGRADERDEVRSNTGSPVHYKTRDRGRGRGR